MKVSKLFSLILLSLLFLYNVTFANDELDPRIKAQYSTVEKNLLEGLKSDNEGLRVSCEYYLGEMKSKKAVIPLMHILRDDPSYPARIVAALSLIKIEDPQGVYMVGRSIDFNTNEGVRKMSKKFYLSHLLKKYLEQHPEKAPDFAFLGL